MFEVNIAKILYVIISILIPSFSVAQSGTFTTTVTVRGTVITGSKLMAGLIGLTKMRLLLSA